MMNCITTKSRISPAALSTMLLLACACGDAASTPPTPMPSRGVVVLDGYVQPGLTLVADTGAANTRVAFGSPSEFDASAFTLRNDTALAVTSSAAGDLLFVADLRAGSVRRVQLPAGGNGATARLLGGGNGAARIGVALRDSGAIAVVSAAANASPSIALLRAAGRCPTDLFEFGAAVWSVDANANCREGTYASAGNMRLIRFPAGVVNHDTVTLVGLVGSAAAAEVIGGFAYVASGGVADFSNYPATTFATPGAVAKIDLATRQVVKTLSLPQGTYGGALHAGLDGRLYVTAYTTTTFASTGVFAIDAAALEFTGARVAGKQYLNLRKTAEVESPCVAATADAAGRVYCIENGRGTATLYIYDRNGALIRSAPAGSAAVDLGLR